MIKKQIPIFLSTVLLLSCGKSKVYENHQELDPKLEWKKATSVAFSVDIPSSDTTYDVAVLLRHISGYPYQTCPLNIVVTTPDGNKISEKLTLKIRSGDGSYNSKCMGDICDHKTLLYTNRKFEKAGTYRFEYTYDVDVPKITHVMDLGMLVTYHEPE